MHPVEMLRTTRHIKRSAYSLLSSNPSQARRAPVEETNQGCKNSESENNRIRSLQDKWTRAESCDTESATKRKISIITPRSRPTMCHVVLHHVVTCPPSVTCPVSVPRQTATRPTAWAWLQLHLERPHVASYRKLYRSRPSCGPLAVPKLFQNENQHPRLSRNQYVQDNTCGASLRNRLEG